MAPPRTSARPRTVTAYIAAAPREARPHLRALRQLVRAAAPDADESLKWSMPSYSYRRILLNFAAHQSHLGFYMTPSVLRAFKKQLTKYATSHATIQFPYNQPLPLPLLRRIVAARVKDSLEHDGKWRT
jgi:uncharacterized protein YdhG (YjbR/CyaY superfamily)